MVSMVFVQVQFGVKYHTSLCLCMCIKDFPGNTFEPNQITSAYSSESESKETMTYAPIKTLCTIRLGVSFSFHENIWNSCSRSQLLIVYYVTD